MKIFNWVNRKFHNKDGWMNAGELKKEKKGAEQNSFEQVALADVIASWRHDILTIGTFGFDPLNDFNQLKHIQLISVVSKDEVNIYEKEGEEEDDDEQSSDFVESCNDNDEEEEEEEDGDENPLVLHASKHGFNSTASTNDNIVNNNSTDTSADDHQESEIIAFTTDDDDDDGYNNLAYDYKKIDKKECRVTLADLFSADPDHHIPTEPAATATATDCNIITKKEDSTHSKSSKLPFSEKLLVDPQGKHKQDHVHSRPIKKIHRMMTRMLKRKIHPDREAKNQKMKENHIKTSTQINGGNERVFLVQTQDPIACA